ncbi:MAG: NAD(P)-dependent dehydrogenase (short-subunit alcohol dehydrogenase family) [Candidatus Azotimanducaceae bacterium]|jgi:NAD(P)-dependent dehydrogenase (short-subunit alcohol dehydrogenase family)
MQLAALSIAMLSIKVFWRSITFGICARSTIPELTKWFQNRRFKVRPSNPFEAQRGRKFMTDIMGRIVFITGAANGIGYSLAKSFAGRGAKIMLADKHVQNLTLAEESLRALGADVASVICDVTNLDSMKAAAQATLDRFAKVHIVVNNAGVPMNGRPGRIPMEDWRWVMDINLMGVVHGVEVFAPILQEQGEGGHFLNTASMAGLMAQAGVAPYVASKFAVVGYSESLRDEVAADNIGVSVLCPGYVKTGIHSAMFDRPSLKTTTDESVKGKRYEGMNNLIENGMDPDSIANWAVDCVVDNRFYVFANPEIRQAYAARSAAILADFDALISDGRFSS